MKKKQIARHRADDRREDHPAAIRICIYFVYPCTSVCVLCNIRCTGIHEGQFVMKSKRSFNAFSTLLHLNRAFVYSANPFTYCFPTHAFFTRRIEKKSCYKLKALILKTVRSAAYTVRNTKHI